MNVLLAVLLLTGTLPQQAPPTDPLQKAAASFLRQHKDPADWKVKMYLQIVARGVSGRSLARRTTYCPNCSGTHACDSSPVRLGTCAASKNIPLHSIVWLEGVGFLLVTDRGGKVYVREGMTADVDQWVPNCTGAGGTVTKHWALILRGDGNQNRNSNRQPVNDFERAIRVQRK